MKSFNLLFFGVWSIVSISQNNKVFPLKTISVDNGISANSVFAIEQDSLGYLWLASPNGLNRYDGKSFKFFPKNFVSEGDIIAYDKKLYRDKEGVLWIITGERHIEKYNIKEDKFQSSDWFPLPKTIFQDRNLNRYVGTSENGIFKIDHKKKDTVQLLRRQDFPENVNEFTEYKNHIWASSTAGIFKIDEKGAYEIIKVPIPDYSDITLIDSSIKNGLWVGTYMNGLYYLDSTTETFVLFNGFENQSFPKDLYIHNVFFDSKNRLWIGSYGQGIYLIDFENFSISHIDSEKNNPFTLQYNCVSSIYEDSNKTIWFGTDGGGVSYYDENLVKFKSLTDKQLRQDFNLKMVKSLALDTNKNLWIATHNYGLLKLDSEKNNIESFTENNSGLNTDKISSIRFIDDDLWIANEKYEIQILSNDGSFKTYNEKSEPKLDVGYIYEIFQDSKKRIWLTTADNGLIQFDKSLGVVKEFKNHPENFNTISSNLIFSIEEDINGLLWLGTKYKGLCSIDINTNTISRYPQIKGMIRSIHSDKRGNLWVGTNTNGLIFFNHETDKVTTYAEAEGLSGNTVFAILQDADNLWLSTNRGISKFNTITNEIENFGIEEGLQSLEFNDNAAVKDLENNILYFGGLKGVSWFNPYNLEINTSRPQTRISKIEVNDEAINMYDKGIFNNKENTVNFTFASLHYAAPEKNQFKYRLINYDKDWQSNGNINTIRYTNLPPNDYEFQVISSNYDGVWNEDPATYSFTVNKPWYGTNTAYIIYVVLLLLSLFLLFKYLKWRLLITNQLAFETKEAVRLKQLDEFKNRLFTNISHEFRTPLTLISGPIENQLSRPNINKKDKEELSLVKRNANRLLNLVNQILDLSRLESGQLQLNVEYDNLEVLVKQIVSAFEFKAQKKQINFQKQIVDLGKAWFDKDIVEKVISNLLSNAMKYTPAKGLVKFNTFINNGQLILTITNSDKNITQDRIQKMFDRYYQGHRNNDGAGIGLSLVKELILLSHGSIVANKLNDDEIQFTVSLPIEKSLYNASEISNVSNEIKDTPNSEFKIEPSDVLTDTNKLEKPKVLIVDDDDDIRLYLRAMLSDRYKLIEASNGEIGIEKAINSIPDLIVSDIMMPVLDGIALCNTIKHDEKTSHIPIILLTAKTDTTHEIEGLKIGADAYVTKPFNKDKLQIQIANLIAIRKQLQLRYGQNFKLKELAMTNIEQAFVKRLKAVLDNNITNSEFNVEALSGQLGMSRMQLYRKLKAMTGLSASEFMANERLKLALQLLKTTDRSISEIAYETGFNTPSYFSRCFKKVHGQSPINFRENQ